MATVYTPPIDLYAESDQDDREMQEKQDRPARPSENGVVDPPAVEQSHQGLERVLGW